MKKNLKKNFKRFENLKKPKKTKKQNKKKHAKNSWYYGNPMKLYNEDDCETVFKLRTKQRKEQELEFLGSQLHKVLDRINRDETHFKTKKKSKRISNYE